MWSCSHRPVPASICFRILRNGVGLARRRCTSINKAARRKGPFDPGPSPGPVRRDDDLQCQQRDRLKKVWRGWLFSHTTTNLGLSRDGPTIFGVPDPLPDLAEVGDSPNSILPHPVGYSFGARSGSGNQWGPALASNRPCIVSAL